MKMCVLGEMDTLGLYVLSVQLFHKPTTAKKKSIFKKMVSFTYLSYE